MKINSIKIILFSVIFLIWLTQTTIINAQEEKIDPAITLAPAIFDLDVHPCQSIEENIGVINETEFAMPIKIDLSNYSQDEDGIPYYTEDNSIWKPEEWIILENTDIILNPKETRDIKLQLQIPEKIKSGSYFAVIFFKPVLPEEYFKAYSAHIIPYIGAIITLNVEEADTDHMQDFLEIEHFSTEREDNVKFFSKLKNKDIYYHKVDGQISIRNFLNREIGNIPVRDTTLFPGKSRNLSNPYEGKLFWGKYSAQLTMGDNNTFQDETISFWILPPIWTMILLIPISFIIYIIVFKQKNLKKAIKILTDRESVN